MKQIPLQKVNQNILTRSFNMSIILKNAFTGSRKASGMRCRKQGAVTNGVDN